MITKTKRSSELNTVVKKLMSTYKSEIIDWDWIDKVIIHEIYENWFIEPTLNDIEYIKATWKSQVYKSKIDR